MAHAAIIGIQRPTKSVGDEIRADGVEDKNFEEGIQQSINQARYGLQLYEENIPT
jgi:hypothetical protein